MEFLLVSDVVQVLDEQSDPQSLVVGDTQLLQQTESPV